MMRLILFITLFALSAIAITLASPPNVARDVAPIDFSTERALSELRVIVLLTIVLAGALARSVLRASTPLELSLGIAAVYALAMVPLSNVAPGGSYLFSFPLIGLAIGIFALLLSNKAEPTVLQAIVLPVGASIPILLGAPLIKQLHVALGFQLPALTSLITFLFVAMAAPLLLTIAAPLFRRDPGAHARKSDAATATR